MDRSHLDKMQQPGWSNRAAAQSPFDRNADGTVPADAVVPADPSHVASVQPKADTPKPDAPKPDAHVAQDEPKK